MKGGVALALTVLEVLAEARALPTRRITLVCTSDEETGSHTSRHLIETLARDHEVVFCLEPGLADGSVKTWRKGIGDFELEVTGRAAHAGANPEAGVNAILEMAGQIERLRGLADPAAGTTVNPGVIQGGTLSNVVPALCRLQFDIRVTDERARRKVQQGLDRMQPILPEARIEIRGEWNRPPMPRSPSISATYERVRSIGRDLGLKVTEGGSGGGSDANFVAPLGIPVLDGMGPIGNHAHSEREYIVRSSLPTRAALLAACLTEW
jgi:glutamate carboxypeptidase